MKKNNKLQELVSNQVANAIETAKKDSKTSKSETPATATAETKKLKKLPNAAKAETKTKAVKEAKKQQEVALLESVVSKREVKYIYPDNVQDTLARKKWRQEVRNKLHKLEMEMHRIKDQNSKEYKAAEKKFKDYQRTVLKPNQVA